MSKLNASEIQALCWQVGVNANSDVAVAIALAESGGNTTDHNQIPPDDSYGLWQINMFPGAHTKKELGISKNEDLFDPITNAKAMAKISNGGKNWTAWTTYTSGKYKFYMNGAASGAQGGGTNAEALNPFGPLADKVADSHFWARIGEYILGFVLILIGLILIIGAGKARQITSIANKVAG